MAEPATVADVYTLAGQHGDIRREAAEHSANIRRETAFEAGDIRRDVAKESSDTRQGMAKAAYDLQYSVGNEADRVTAQDTAYFIAGTAAATQTAKEAAKERAWIEAGMNAGFVKVAGDSALHAAVVNGNIALEAAKTQGALALSQALLGQQIAADGSATRALMNEMRGHDQNRALIERNALLVEALGDARHCHSGLQNAQFAAVTSQLNAFQSQLQETRQGINNFGSMAAGAGTQTSTSNNA